jgi:hypothetical protein
VLPKSSVPVSDGAGLHVFNMLVCQALDVCIVPTVQLLSKADEPCGPSGGSPRRPGQSPRKRALCHPAFQTLATLLVAQCHGGAFNPQSTANAWWVQAAGLPSSCFLALQPQHASAGLLTLPHTPFCRRLTRAARGSDCRIMQNT